LKSLTAALFALILSTAVAAPMALKPGLWLMQVDIDNNGKKMNISEEMNKAMAKMSPEQKAQMQKMMGNVAIPSNEGTQTCFTQEMFTPEKMIARQAKGKCTPSFKTQTPKLVEGTFSCEDGTKGHMKWAVTSDELMNGTVDMESPKRGQMKMVYTGKFVKTDCGSIRPAVQ